jgi:hypothetical protein
MGWLIVIFGVGETYEFYSEGPALLASVAGLMTMLNCWSYGVMHNFAVEAAKRRPTYRGDFADFTDGEAAFVPGWVANVNLLTALTVLALLICLVVRLLA